MDLEDGETSYEEAKQRFFDRVASGAVSLDGIMSPLTRTLAERFGAQSVDMTLGGRVPRWSGRAQPAGDPNRRSFV